MRRMWIVTLVSALVTLSFAFQAPAVNRKKKKKRVVIEKKLSPLSIEINVPAYRLDLFYASDLMKSYRVGVGHRSFPTTPRKYHIEYVEWNPWWYAPSSDWARGSGSAYPGPINPLGPVKMSLRGRGRYLVHGTNKPDSVGRCMSHGCIRMLSDDATELALSLMVLVGTPGPFRAPTEYTSDYTQTHKVHLRGKVIVETVYRRAEIRKDVLTVHPDVYNRQPVTLASIRMMMADKGYRQDPAILKKITKMLNTIGRDTARVPLKKLPESEESSESAALPNPPTTATD